ncbi:hypothetical protein K505DRAFT_381146 [Melanomma pulvis-pyrius CBS 109.77]|uniref:Secreted protein n=1 Tax=Melanomma pulvis-pyrius CBS 109.77 TaxID=1314802 RepID=A0A6A6XJC7_9PLEO|nr:hypothetical protein K505DRAFT_381146 [Melanomma pulvis-pyrius CBS 109.77]
MSALSVYLLVWLWELKALREPIAAFPPYSPPLYEKHLPRINLALVVHMRQSLPRLLWGVSTSICSVSTMYQAAVMRCAMRLSGKASLFRGTMMFQSTSVVLTSSPARPIWVSTCSYASSYPLRVLRCLRRDICLVGGCIFSGLHCQYASLGPLYFSSGSLLLSTVQVEERPPASLLAPLLSLRRTGITRREAQIVEEAMACNSEVAASDHRWEPLSHKAFVGSRCGRRSQHPFLLPRSTERWCT